MRRAFLAFRYLITSCVGDHERSERLLKWIGRTVLFLESIQRHVIPRMLGLQRVQARTLAGLAAACAVQGETPRAKQYLDAAVEKTAELFHQPQTWIWNAGLPNLYYGFAVARVAMAETDLALEALERAVRAGWRDVKFLVTDPQISSLRSHPQFHAIAERIRRIPALDFSIRKTELAQSA